jgi:hypothetical protein
MSGSNPSPRLTPAAIAAAASPVTTMAARIDDLLVLGQNISKTDLAKYLRDREAVLPFDFGGLGDGAANDRAAIQACFDRAAADRKFAIIPPGTWRVDAGVVLGGGARGLIMQGVIQYTGATNAPATVLTLGDGGTTRNGEKLYLGLQVTRQIQSDWLSEDDIGILARNLDSSLIDLRLVSGFTIGLRTLGDGRGFEDSTLLLGRILNNCYGIDAHAATATAWNTSIRYYGGHFACGTGINPALDRFGVRFSRGAADAYNNHNRHVFDAPNFELRQLDTNIAIPFLNETNGTAIIARNMPGARRGDFADASLDTSSIAFVLDCHVWSNDKVRVTARNVSLSTVDLPAALLHVQVVKRRVG